ncbi:peroxiredoxin [Kribbella voronezhensis]|uniref:thioredoxin-dependent peroxiredoxin n=1 Tax=Kribbella voronezhensis TaxID=2512212 RepID=A0A4R7T9G1_9ACTN|nr:redoxin domain-containing protein [Kribbella voronezhensis]TDU88515.1 peroxiredoxin [Kribbella voronezhensis]
MLEIGSAAPLLELEDTEGQRVTLADLVAEPGRRGVLVYFLRSASCPVCNLHVRKLIKKADEYAGAGVQIMVAVPEDREEAARWKAKGKIPFRVVTGRRGSPHEAIGLVRKLFGSMQQSGSILVDADNVIRHAHGATNPMNSYDRARIAAAVEQLRVTSTS